MQTCKRKGRFILNISVILSLCVLSKHRILLRVYIVFFFGLAQYMHLVALLCLQAAIPVTEPNVYAQIYSDLLLHSLLQSGACLDDAVTGSKGTKTEVSLATGAKPSSWNGNDLSLF